MWAEWRRIYHRPAPNWPGRWNGTTATSPAPWTAPAGNWPNAPAANATWHPRYPGAHNTRPGPPTSGNRPARRRAGREPRSVRARPSTARQAGTCPAGREAPTLHPGRPVGMHTLKARAQTMTSPTIAGQHGSRIITALEHAWTAIQNLHPDIPDVVIVPGAGSSQKGSPEGYQLRGHHWPERWVLDGQDQPAPPNYSSPGNCWPPEAAQSSRSCCTRPPTPSPQSAASKTPAPPATATTTSGSPPSLPRRRAGAARPGRAGQDHRLVALHVARAGRLRRLGRGARPSLVADATYPQACGLWCRHHWWHVDMGDLSPTASRCLCRDGCPDRAHRGTKTCGPRQTDTGRLRQPRPFR